MAALTKSRNTPELADGGRIRILDVEANRTIFIGSMVAVNEAGNAVPACETRGTPNNPRIIGRAEYVVNGMPSQNGVNVPGDAGAMRIAVRKGVFMYAQDGTIGLRSIGRPAFAIDDQTVSAKQHIYERAIAGEVVAVDPSGEVWIDFWHQR
jgi:hypothetical protein